ncbi:hypothetical protein CDD82_904 [Ophiocordyceps australis]|uniref:DUF833 domain-containing protein n=1 Tax=Ophiocordyceps australis TaxID=1399860 RepID=A0A2C5ZK02_9HYPO|nr:hypothetical protein CDD82_904 [Ophiocordyceps australis]
MCIVLLTTAHPDYALILIDNRDEFILRPTSRPQWWKHPLSGEQVLSSRDLQRAEQGTWLGITPTGLLAVLTNYREKADAQTGAIRGTRSRGRMVTAWLGGLADGAQGLDDGVKRLLDEDGGVGGIGGFSMLGGKLRRRGGGVAVISNRATRTDQVPVIARERDQTWGLSNTVFDDPDEWPKVREGKRLLLRAVERDRARKETGVEAEQRQRQLVEELFEVLDCDTLPRMGPQASFNEYIGLLKQTIYVPVIGDTAAVSKARRGSRGSALVHGAPHATAAAVDELAAEQQRPEASGRRPSASGVNKTFEEGPYGTQRQTVMLVDWDGNVTFIERALWDAEGNEIVRGSGDAVFCFQIEGWDE